MGEYGRGPLMNFPPRYRSRITSLCFIRAAHRQVYYLFPHMVYLPVERGILVGRIGPLESRYKVVERRRTIAWVIASLVMLALLAGLAGCGPGPTPPVPTPIPSPTTAAT